MALRINANKWLKTTARKVARDGATYARPHIPSQTLRQAMRVVEGDNPGEASIYIPHFWALFVHDGRGPINMRPGAYMVWFRDRGNDPRLNGGHSPERMRDIRHLSAAEFRYWQKQNQVADKVGAPRPMIVAKSVKGTKGTRFFDNKGAMRIFKTQAKRVIREEFDKFVRRELAKLPNGRKIIVAI